MTEEKKKTETKSASAPKPKAPQVKPAPKAKKAEATIYVGPTLRGGRLTQSTLFRGGELPANVKELAENHAAIKRLIVPVSKLGAVESKLKDPTTPEAAYYAEAARLFSKGVK